jgi:hypothetical protein
MTTYRPSNVRYWNSGVVEASAVRRFTTPVSLPSSGISTLESPHRNRVVVSSFTHPSSTAHWHIAWRLRYAILAGGRRHIRHFRHESRSIGRFSEG